MNKRSMWVGLLLVFGLTAACGGDDGDSAERPDRTEDEGQAATGEPIRLATFTSPSNLPTTTAGAETAIAAINADGGVDGRPLELVTCDNENDANKAAECARGFVSDPKVMATVGVISVFGGDTNPIFEQASLAGVGMAPAGSGDFDSPVVFPNSLSTQAFLGTSAILYDKLDAQDQGLVMVDSPAAVAIEGSVNKFVLGPRGTSLKATAVIPLTAADVAPQAAALGSTDGQAVALTPDLAVRYIQASRQQGYDGPIIASASQLSAEKIEESLGGAVDDLYVVGTFDYDSDGWSRMLDEAADNGVDPAIINDTFATAWLGVQMFAEAAAELDEITREGVLEAMGQLSDFDTEGMTPTSLDFTVPGTAFDGDAPRIVPSITSVYAYRYENGGFVSVDNEPQPVFGDQ